jgi:hypothetical protein
VKIQILDLPGICLVFATATLLVSFDSGLNAADFAGASADDVTLSEYNFKDLSLLTQVHADRLFKDYEHHGFFRIGLLPVPVAENVQIQIQSADCLTNATLALSSWNQPSAGVRRLELRNLEIKLFGDRQPRLSAVSARVGRDGVLDLSAVSVFNVAGGQMSIPKAILQVAGSSAGWLHWNYQGQPQEIFLFKPTPDETP